MHAESLSRRAALCRAGAAAALVAAVGGGRSAAAQGTVAGHPIVGTWWVASVPPGAVLLLATYHADGTYADGGPPVSPAPPGAPHQLEHFGSGRGVWAALDDRRATATLAVHRADEDGTYLGAFVSRRIAELDETQDAYRGTWTVDVLDAAGTKVASFPVTTEGRRLTLEPAEATTAGTPVP